MRSLQLFVIISICVALGSCKKDLLHWQKVTQLNSNTHSQLNHVKFLNNRICIACGGVTWSQSNVVISVDGGYTWASDTFSSPQIEMFGMGISANGSICLSGHNGEILYSKDSGSTWQHKQISNWLEYVGGSFVTPDIGIFASTVLQRQSAITRVNSNFDILDEQTFQFGLNNIYMVSSSAGYVVGYGTVMITKDRGNTWNFQNVQGDNFEAMSILGNEIWMCGYMGSIFHTTDGGSNWQRQRNGNDVTLARYYLLDILFKDAQHGWAVCDNGKVIYTDDGGNHWEEYTQFTTNSLRSIALCPNGDLLVVGDNGSIFRLATQQ